MIVRRARYRNKDLPCHRCGALIPHGSLYLDLERGGKRWCDGCAGGGLAHPSEPTPLQRVTRRVRMEPAPEHLLQLGDGFCWLWTGPLGMGGYARASAGWAHRWSYETLIGPVPSGLHLDHLCKRRSCVAPHHLEPVSVAENNRRSKPAHAEAMRRRVEQRTHCKNGHPFTPDNTEIRERGGRRCRECRRQTVRRHEARKRAASCP